MPKISQNLIILKDPFDDPYEISYDGGNMALNRFCIDEDAAFELSGVHHYMTWSSGKEFSPETVYRGISVFDRLYSYTGK